MTTGEELEVDLQLTNRCPLACDHCVYSSSMRCGPGLPLELVRRLTAEFSELGVAQVSITGGEPFLRSDLPEAIAALSEAGLEVCVQTSGAVTGRVELDELSRRGLDLLLVSIDGPAEFHDRFRHRPGLWRRAWETVDEAVSLGLSVRINTVVSPANRELVIDLLPMARDRGVEVFSFFYCSPLGRGASLDHGPLSLSEWAQFEGELGQWCRSNRRDQMTVKVQRVASEATDLTGVSQSCRISRRDNILILANGEVYPCVFVHDDREMCLGNVHDQPLTAIWKSSPRWDDAYSRLLEVRGRDCRGELAETCSGGCPAFRRRLRREDGRCDRRCEWSDSGLVPACSRQYTKLDPTRDREG